LIKTATPEKIAFYKEALYPAQDKILNAISETFGDVFYLTGGTALSRFYFRHKLSEDLDLLTETENIKTAIPRIVKILESPGYKVDVKAMSITFGRLFVFLEDGEKLKIDLAADYPTEKPKAAENFYVDTISNIAVNKIAAFEDRAEAKDLVNLYFLVKERGINLEEVLELADRKKVPVPYEELLTINATGLTGNAFLLKRVEAEALEDFLEELKKILKKNVKKRVREARRLIEYQRKRRGIYCPDRADNQRGRRGHEPYCPQRTRFPVLFLLKRRYRTASHSCS